VEVSIDPELCQGHLQCVFIAPELFGEGHDGRAYVRLGTAPSELEDGARDAANNCPEQAIRVTEVER
jgi:ferredoxin